MAAKEDNTREWLLDHAEHLAYLRAPVDEYRLRLAVSGVLQSNYDQKLGSAQVSHITAFALDGAHVLNRGR